jgi:hypothetical protein
VPPHRSQRPGAGHRRRSPMPDETVDLPTRVDALEQRVNRLYAMKHGVVR